MNSIREFWRNQCLRKFLKNFLVKINWKIISSVLVILSYYPNIRWTWTICLNCTSESVNNSNNEQTHFIVHQPTAAISFKCSNNWLFYKCTNFIESSFLWFFPDKIIIVNCLKNFINAMHWMIDIRSWSKVITYDVRTSSPIRKIAISLGCKNLVERGKRRNSKSFLTSVPCTKLSKESTISFVTICKRQSSGIL